MRTTLYHQTENTNLSELSTYVYDYNSWEFNTAHFHKNMEIVLVIEGTCSCFVGSGKYLLTAGEALFVLPYQSHGFTVGEGSSVRCVTFSSLLILTLAKILEGNVAKSPVFRPRPETTAYFLEQLLLIFGRRSGYNKQIPPVGRMKAKGLLYLIGSEFLESAELVPIGVNLTLAAEIVQYLEENYKKDISLHDVAELTGYNYQYLSRSFNKVFGVSFKQMLNRYRLDCAYALLQDTDLPISEIAFESGFQSIRSFDQTVLDQYGVSPKELRRRARREGAESNPLEKQK